MVEQNSDEKEKKDNLIIKQTDLEWVKNNIQNSFSGMFLTLLSIIHGVVLSVWAQSIPDRWGNWLNIWSVYGTEKIAIGFITLLLVIFTWHSYFWLAAVATWTPKLGDSLFVFAVGAMEFVITKNMGNPMWYFAVGFFGILGGAQYMYNAERLPDALWGSDARTLGSHIRDYKKKRGCCLICISVVVLVITSAIYILYPQHLWGMAFVFLAVQLWVMSQHSKNQGETYNRIVEATSNENGNKYNVIVTRDKKDWLVSDVAELPGCHTQAKNMNDLLERTKEAIQAYLESDSSYESKVEFIKIRQI